MRNVIQDILKYAGSCPECNEIMEIRSIALSVWPAQDCFQYVTQFCCEFQKESLFLNFSWNVLQHAYNSHNQENYPDILRYFFYFGGGGGGGLYAIPHAYIPLYHTRSFFLQQRVYSLQKTGNFSGRNACVG